MFRTLTKHWKTFDDDRRGATATEYVILLILIACVVISIVKLYGTTVSKKYDTANDTVRKEVVAD